MCHSIVSDEKLAVIGLGGPIRNATFLSCFQQLVFVFSLHRSSHDMSWGRFLWGYPVGDFLSCLNLQAVSFTRSGRSPATVFSNALPACAFPVLRHQGHEW